MTEALAGVESGRWFRDAGSIPTSVSIILLENALPAADSGNSPTANAIGA